MDINLLISDRLSPIHSGDFKIMRTGQKKTRINLIFNFFLLELSKYTIYSGYDMGLILRKYFTYKHFHHKTLGCSPNFFVEKNKQTCNTGINLWYSMWNISSDCIFSRQTTLSHWCFLCIISWFNNFGWFQRNFSVSLKKNSPLCSFFEVFEP